ncbi:MAG: hypothetical protein R3Y47_05475 [Lachnospiraceae bacterium]
MIKKFKVSLLFAVVLTVCLSFAGCATNADLEESQVIETTTDEQSVDTSVLVISGLSDEDISFSYEDIKAMSDFDEDVESLTSSGEINKAHIKGTTVDAILESVGLTKDACETARIVASDGYEISVPNDVLMNQNLVIAFEEDGVEYDAAEYGAFRTIIPNERAMYWVKGVVKLHFELSQTVSESYSQLIFVDNAYEVIPYVDFEYYDEVADSLSVADLMAEYVTLGEEQNGFFIAGDGLESEQTLEILDGGIFKMTGEDAPMFINPDMPKGMQVKGMKYFKLGDTCFVALMTVDAVSEEVVTLQSILNEVGMTSGSYLVTSVKGEETVLEGKVLADITVELQEDGYYLVSADETIKIKAVELVQQ